MAQSTTSAAAAASPPPPFPPHHYETSRPSYHSTRSNSIVSTASSGAASLRRKSRTRTRTLTSSGQRGKSSLGERHQQQQQPEIVANVPGKESVVPGVPNPDAGSVVPSVPARSETAGTDEGASSSVKASTSTQKTIRLRGNTATLTLGVLETTRGRQVRSEGGSLRGARRSIRCASLPRHALKTSMSSDSSAQPSPLTPDGEFYPSPAVQVALSDVVNARNSIISRRSFTSSSLYPASTSSSSHADSSLLPYSVDGDTDREHDDAFGPTIVSPNSAEFDPDDVSYRLRLLVNNNYFLPPAHAKPSPLSLKPAQPDPPTKSSKSANATFLDFFRIGKSKSKPTTPGANGPDAAAGPILRTTSDSTSASGHVPRPKAHTSPPTPLHVTSAVPQAAPTRIVVLRERMDDLVVAAKAAEKDIRSRADGRKGINQNAVDDVIDPTDAVDLPPSAYPFAVQTSTAYGLGVRDSLGAALLADQLPPPNSPGVWSLSSEEDAWRKALLSEAVSHSLNTSTSTEFSESFDHHGSPMPPMSPNSQSFHTSRPSTASTPSALSSSVVAHSEELGGPLHPSQSAVQLIGQRILPDLKIETLPAIPSKPTTPTDSRGPAGAAAVIGTVSVPASEFSPSKETMWTTNGTPPSRADTPPKTFPLAPPPRKQLINPLYSLSQPDLPDVLHRDSSQDTSSEPSPVVRRAVSSPKLSSSRDRSNSRLRSALSFTPPPLVIQQRKVSPYSADNTGESRLTLTSNMSVVSCSDEDDISYSTPMETDGDRPEPRPSITVSLSGGRPSFADSLHPSPTASAFQDALFGSFRSPSVLSRRSFASDRVPSREPSPLPIERARSAAVVSPPPRVSMSLAQTILPPPPRSPAVKPVYRPSLSSSHASSDLSRRSFAPTISAVDIKRTPSAVDTTDMLPVASASSITVPLAERRGRVSTLSLRIPNEGIPPAIHSAPAPASPTDFFDRIQEAQYNAMDDLETSDEDDDSSDHEQELRQKTTTVYVDPRPSPAIANRASSSSSSRPSIMRLGNFSTPQLAPSPPMAEPLPSFDLRDRPPVGNVPLRREFFSRKKGVMNTPQAPLPTVQVSAPPRSPPPPASSRTRTTSMKSRSVRRRPATANEAEGRGKQWQRESLQRFDGMLLRHLESERDTIKRIASNISSSKS